MKSSFIFVALSMFAAQIVNAAPAKRDNGPSDVDILQFALTLEHLEATYYKEYLGKYSANDFEAAGYPPWVRNRFDEIRNHEETHVEFLSTALQGAGVKPVEACEYDFPVTDVPSFLGVSYILESVGVSAYTGAAPLISNKDYLEAAASIDTVEARHAAWINSAAQKQNPWGTAFDASLSLNAVYTLASPFIKSCPSSNQALPVKAYPALALPAGATPDSHCELTFDIPKDARSKQLYAIFKNGGNTVSKPITVNGDKKEVDIPEGLFGITYVFVSE